MKLLKFDFKWIFDLFDEQTTWKNATGFRGFLDYVSPRHQDPRNFFSVFGLALERSYIFILGAFRDADSVDGANELIQILCFDWLTN